PAARVARVTGADQPRVAALESPYTMATSPVTTRTTPGTSSRVPRRDGMAGSRRKPATSVAAAPGTLTNRHHRQSRDSVRAPPNTRPGAPARPAIAPNPANALARSFAAVNVTASSDSAVGASSAAHAPCTARAATSAVKFGAAPPAAEASAKPARPTRKAR